MRQLGLRWILAAIAVVLWTGAGAKSMYAQATNTGTVIGQVTDPSGALIPDAKITLSDPSAGVTLNSATNAQGKFLFSDVQPGTYTITASKSGFSETKSTGLVVNVSTQLTANLTLTVGSESETVEVTAVGTELQTLNATVGQTIGVQAIQSLPSLGHDADTFANLQPGVSPNGSVAGTYNDNNTYLLDGGNNSSDMDGSNSVYITGNASVTGDPTGVATSNGELYGPPSGVMPVPQDSVDEEQVNSANQTADFNNSSGSEVELVTPRGTNRWHGSAYEYYLDNGFDANTWNNNQYGIPLTQYHYSRFGARAGGFLTPSWLGGKFYFFGFFEGYRYPQSTTVSRIVPTASLKAGTFTAPDGSATYPMTAVDPRGIGLNPVVSAMWSKYEPTGNIAGGGGGAAACGTLYNGTTCDGYNEAAFTANMSLPLSSNDMVFRMDHDFNSKMHWFASYRYYKLTQAVDAQYDIGGFFPGDTLGTPVSTANRPIQPWYFVTGLTTSISSNTTNEFHYSFLRNYWAWSDQNAPPQVSGLGGAMEPFGESSAYVLAPFNVDTQDIRTRFWDGHDNFFSDNVSVLKGNHLLQFGGQYQHNYDYHQRSDNGGGINFTPTYQLGGASSQTIDGSDLLDGFPNNENTVRLASAAFGMVSSSQVVYTRSGNALTLNPPLTHAFDQQTIPYYNAYFTDTWHMKPSLTLNYGMGYTLEMPPTEKEGKSTMLVDTADEPVVAQDYLAQREAAAEQGQVYNPQLGFALVGNVGQGTKYPYDPFYGSFSPRVGVAWNPGFSKSTVVRGGYGRIYGRLNGVNQVLVPLLGVGLMQAVSCSNTNMNGTCASAQSNAANAFRVGIDGNSAPLPPAAATLPQPAYPGYNLNAAEGEALDPHYRPNAVDSFDLSIQHQLNSKMLVEVGYIGRLIHHEFSPFNLNAVPYMMSVGGQQFQQAYANLEKYLGCATSAAACGSNVPAAGTAAYTSYVSAVTTQPFFEKSLAGTGYCNGYASCTAAVLNNELSNLTEQAVWSLWSDLDNGGFNTSVIPRSMQNTPIPGSTLGSSGQAPYGMALNASEGYGNYNGGFVTFAVHDWHGLTAQSNLTWSKALGTESEAQASSESTPDNAFDLGTAYGEQAFDRRIVFNTYIIAQEPWYKGQHGFLGRVAGGWQLAPLFTAGSGAPVWCNTWTNAQSFGAGDGIGGYFDDEQCVFTSQYNAGHSAHIGVAGGTDAYGHAVATPVSSPTVNLFKDPVAVWNQVRAPILGIDTKNPGTGPFMGQPYWNLDGQIKKDIRIAESTTFEFSFIATNMLNHRQFQDPYPDVNDPAGWGVMNVQANNPRQMEFGGRINF
jgi:Carboxypeptidase regulatory-like domain